MVPEWLQWEKVRESAHDMLNQTVNVSNQYLIRNNLPPIDMTSINSENASHYAQVVVGAIGTGVVSLFRVTSAAIMNPEEVLPPAVYNVLNYNMTIPVPESMQGMVGSDNSSGNGNPNGEERGTDTEIPASNLIAQASSTVWSYVSYGVSTTTNVIIDSLNQRLQDYVDQIDDEDARNTSASIENANVAPVLVDGTSIENANVAPVLVDGKEFSVQESSDTLMNTALGEGIGEESDNRSVGVDNNELDTNNAV